MSANEPKRVLEGRFETGEIGVCFDGSGELELYRVDLGWKYSIPVFDGPKELAAHLRKMADWLEENHGE